MEARTVDESATIKRTALIEKIESLSNYQILEGGWFEFDYEEYYDGKGRIYFGPNHPPDPPPPPPPGGEG